jgi:hypothetical protein
MVRVESAGLAIRHPAVAVDIGRRSSTTDQPQATRIAGPNPGRSEKLNRRQQNREYDKDDELSWTLLPP